MTRARATVAVLVAFFVDQILAILVHGVILASGDELFEALQHETHLDISSPDPLDGLVHSRERHDIDDSLDTKRRRKLEHMHGTDARQEESTAVLLHTTAQPWLWASSPLFGGVRTQCGVAFLGNMPDADGIALGLD